MPYVAKLETLPSHLSGTLPLPEPSQLAKDDVTAVFFSGFIDAPADGNYTFSIAADTGALLRLHEATVLDADFNYKGGAEASGSILLKAGKHPFSLDYVHGKGTAPMLNLMWSGPGIQKQSVPDAAFSHKVTKE